jgi:two-component system sensor histidine kinase TtrS
MKEKKYLTQICVLLLSILVLVPGFVLADNSAASQPGNSTLNNTSEQTSSDALAGSEGIRIGVLANRGSDIALKEWGPTAEYLSRELAPEKFVIVPLTFNETMQLQDDKKVSFLISNPSVYSFQEYYANALAIATNQVPGDPDPQPVFGGVIFTRSDRNDINNLSDLKGKRFSAVDKSSLGGWQAALKQLRDEGINPETDFILLNFSGTHDASVQAVLNGDVDAGTVRSTQLERMVREGNLDLSQIKVLNNQRAEYPEYPYLLSTSLYPEWTFAMMTGTDPGLAKNVAIALFRMKSDDPATKAAQGSGWAIPQDTTQVHDLLRELQLPPYDKQENLSS